VAEVGLTSGRAGIIITHPHYYLEPQVNTPAIIARVKAAFDNDEESSSGSYGDYYRISPRMGVKFLRRGRKHHDKEKFLQSFRYLELVKEAEILKKASALSNLVPKYYGVIVFQHNEMWYAGLVQEHISGRNLADVEEDTDDAIDEVIERLEGKGIYYTDHNPGNFIRRQGGHIRVIDFSPEWVNFDGDDEEDEDYDSNGGSAGEDGDQASGA
jgi:tRNA A-37 threonylcarbamoyl transferase component Bud32